MLAAFEDASPRDPAGYRNLIRLAERDYGGKVTIEVIAQVDAAGGAPTRLLRLTAAEKQWDIVADALREKQPKLGALMNASRDDVLAYMSFPREHQSAGTGEPRGEAAFRCHRHLSE